MNKFLAVLFLLMMTSISVSGQIPNDGLVAWYPFNGNANDESGNGNNGSVTGAILTDDRFGVQNSAFYFDGISNYIHITDSPSLQIQNSISIIAWFKTDDPDIFNDNEDACLLGKHSTHWCRSFGIHMGDSTGYSGHSYDSIRFVLFQSDNNECSLTVPSHSLYNSSWHQIVSIYDYTEGIGKLYIDGILKKNYTLGQFELMQTTKPLLIACYGYGICGSTDKRGFFHGNIDDIRIYNRALNNEEINALYHEGNFASNIIVNQVSQRNDGSGLIDVLFDFIGSGGTYYISMENSFDGGSTYTAISPGFVSGDVGPINPGTGKHLIWNGKGSNNNTFSIQTKVKLIASINPPAGLPCPGLPTFSYGGQIYSTVLIGSQCWMAQNLNIGTRIDGLLNQANNGNIEKVCYNNLESNCYIYGGLYQWDEAMQYSTTPASRGICPAGWHIPSDEEWTNLTTYLGGESIAGGKMKEAGTIHWLSPNTGATDSNGFTGLPGGWGYGNNFFSSLTDFAYFWSSSQYNTTDAWYRGLGYNINNVEHLNYYKKAGFSLRCIKD